MRNQDTWKPSKYVVRGGRLAGSRDPREVGIGSRLNADLVAEAYERHLKTHARGRLLDLGCGKVPLHAAYQRSISESICVDWANTAHKNEHLDHECDLTQTLPFVDGAFDTVVLSDVLEHIPTPEALCIEIARVLASGGRLIMNVPFFYWLHEEPHDFYRYTEFALRRFMTLAGLEVLVLESVGGAPEVIADMLAKNLVHIPWIGRGLAIGLQWLTLHLVRTGIGQRVSRRTGKKMPLGYFVVAEKGR